MARLRNFAGRFGVQATTDSLTGLWPIWLAPATSSTKGSLAASPSCNSDKVDDQRPLRQVEKISQAVELRPSILDEFEVHHETNQSQQLSRQLHPLHRKWACSARSAPPQSGQSGKTALGDEQSITGSATGGPVEVGSNGIYSVCPTTPWLYATTREKFYLACGGPL